MLRRGSCGLRGTYFLLSETMLNCFPALCYTLFKYVEESRQDIIIPLVPIFSVCLASKYMSFKVFEGIYICRERENSVQIGIYVDTSRCETQRKSS